jgi:hypothetical protein
VFLWVFFEKGVSFQRDKVRTVYAYYYYLIGFCSKIGDFVLFFGIYISKRGEDAQICIKNDYYVE